MLKLHDKLCRVGMPRGLYSGYPRMDIFFQKDVKFHFDWKMVRPDAKKIIWAPHWSINAATKWATFQWNYQFMYEFAKAHPETSWVVKPHPHLQVSAITGNKRVFSSLAELEEYFQKWNDLPNAQVYTGAYYQDIFATSDGLIHDCGSFTAEYQYVDKPMIFLTRANEKFNDLGNKILEVSYLVDGKDLDAIAAMIQKVFIEGNDDKAAERKEVFNKYLNYPNTNGMLASEFIYKNISEKLEAVE
jgi:CDP-glycerol glycerophosphotransferase (TagB/SpsB family)